MKVTAAVAWSHGSPLRLESLQLAEPQADEVLIKLVACGVAEIDLAAIDGHLPVTCPFVPGSEGAGIVERVGRDVSGLAPGDAVVVGFDYCGSCEHCLAGHPRQCVAFAAHNLAGLRPGNAGRPFAGGPDPVNGCFFGQSSFATHALCRAARAIKLAKNSPLEVLACLGGEVLLGAGTILQAFQWKEGDSLVVVGAGAAGLAATMVAKARSAKCIVVMEADERRRTLASELGADAAVHPDANLADLVRSLDADGATFAVETTGQVGALQACAESLRPGAVCAFVGNSEADHLEADGDGGEAVRFVPLEAHASPSVLVPKLAALHASGDLPLEHLVDFFPFEHVNDALQALRSGSVAKPVLRFSVGDFGDLDRALSEGATQDVSDAATGSGEPNRDQPELVKTR